MGGYIEHNLGLINKTSDLDTILMIDVARRHMTREDIKKAIDSMGLPDRPWKLMLHLNDNEGFALDIFNRLGYSLKKSDTYGWLSVDDLDDIVEYAESTNIKIVLDVDIPSHCKALINVLEQSAYSLPTLDETTFDYTQDDVKNFITLMFSELVSLYPECDFNLGFDEIPGNVDNHGHLSTLANKLYNILSDGSNSVHVWNDSLNEDLLADLNSSINIIYWQDSDVNTLNDLYGSLNVIINADKDRYYFNVSDIDNTEYIDERLKTLNIEPSSLIALWGENSENISNTDMCHFINKLSML